MRQINLPILRGIYAQLIQIEQDDGSLSEKQKDRIDAARRRIGLVLKEERGK